MKFKTILEEQNWLNLRDDFLDPGTVLHIPRYINEAKMKIKPLVLVSLR